MDEHAEAHDDVFCKHANQEHNNQANRKVYVGLDVAHDGSAETKRMSDLRWLVHPV